MSSHVQATTQAFNPELQNASFKLKVILQSLAGQSN